MENVFYNFLLSLIITKLFMFNVTETDKLFNETFWQKLVSLSTDEDENICISLPF